MEYVDLGLPSGTLWCTCNLGADSPEKNGNYYFYGGLLPRTSGFFSENDPLWDKTFGYRNVPNKISGSKYDAATMTLGSNYFTPTKENIAELSMYCSTTNEILNGVEVYKVTGRNKNFIYIPKNGYYVGDELFGGGFTAYLWSDEQLLENGGYNTYGYWTYPNAWCLRFHGSIESKSSICLSVATIRRYGLGIRPIYKKTEIKLVDLGLPSGTKWASHCIDGYYSWGEIGTKNNYSMSNYKWYNGTFPKYPVILNTEKNEDVATLKLGTGWHIPSINQWNELNRECSWKYINDQDKIGWNVTGPNGNSIFVLKLGYYDGQEYINYGDCMYWTNQISEYYNLNKGFVNANAAYIGKYNSELHANPVTIEDNLRSLGVAILPVYNLDGNTHDQDDPDIPPTIDPDDYQDPQYTDDKKCGNVILGEWNKGSVRGFDGKLKCKLQYIVNKSPLVTKVFDDQEIVSYTRHDQNEDYVDDGLYFTNNHLYEWTTDLKQKVQSDNLNITAREGNYRYSVPRDDNAKYGNRLRGKYMICTIEDRDPRIDASITYIITKFRASWN